MSQSSSSKEKLQQDESTSVSLDVPDQTVVSKKPISPEIWMKVSVRAFIGLLIALSIVFAIIVKYHEAKRVEIYHETSSQLEEMIFQQLQNQDHSPRQFVFAFDTIAQLRAAQSSPSTRNQAITAIYEDAIEKLKQKFDVDENDKSQKIKHQLLIALLQAKRSQYSDLKSDEASWLRKALQLLTTKKTSEKNHPSQRLKNLMLETTSTLRLSILETDPIKSINRLKKLQDRLEQLSQQAEPSWNIATSERIKAQLDHLQEKPKKHRAAIRELIKHQAKRYDTHQQKVENFSSIDQAASDMILQQIVALDRLVDAKLYFARLNHSKKSHREIIQFYGDEIGKSLQHCITIDNHDSSISSQEIPAILFLKCRSALFQLDSSFPFTDHSYPPKKDQDSKK